MKSATRSRGMVLEPTATADVESENSRRETEVNGLG